MAIDQVNEKQSSADDELAEEKNVLIVGNQSSVRSYLKPNLKPNS